MKTVVYTAIAFLTLVSQPVFAADDPSIKGDTRTGIQSAMAGHIEANMLKDHYIIYDSLTGTLHRLVFKKLHEGIVKKGDFYVSCADFTDGSGRKYDLDFLVADSDSTFRVLQGLVHSVDGKKRKYHVEQTQSD